MDIREIETEVARDEEGVIVPIMQKNGEPYVSAVDGSPSTMTIVGEDSKRHKEADAKAARNARRNAFAGRKVEDQFRQTQIDIASACVIDWHGWEDGKTPLPCTPENVKKVLGYQHILRQVQGAIATHADFFASSSAS